MSAENPMARDWSEYGQKHMRTRGAGRGLVALLLAGMLTLVGCAQTPSARPATDAGEPAQEQQEQAVATMPQTDWSKARVSYLGPEGTYTQEACQVFFGGQGTYEPQEDVAASVQALIDGNADYAVIPQENSIGGPIAEYLDEVVSHEDVCIVGEVDLPISQNLLAKPDAKLEDIKTVYSHKQGIAQGSAWLKEHLPNATVTEVSSTAKGARMASEAPGNDCAAIGSAAAADVYGLSVAADNIQMSDTNKTRFYVLSTGSPATEASDRMAFLASGSAADLAELLASVEAQGMQVLAVHDRPQKTELGNYTYVVECADGGYDAYQSVCKDNPSLEFRYLGSFPVV
ncbi:MAG: prephenate dehydratase domain-containing protein [Coriobacteriales bacterium]|nr:prephenate dehydratase domain-containing protein [Coriobacteriales bacterium]